MYVKEGRPRSSLYYGLLPRFAHFEKAKRPIARQTSSSNSLARRQFISLNGWGTFASPRPRARVTYIVKGLSLETLSVDFVRASPSLRYVVKPKQKIFLLFSLAPLTGIVTDNKRYGSCPKRDVPFYALKIGKTNLHHCFSCLFSQAWWWCFGDSFRFFSDFVECFNVFNQRCAWWRIFLLKK